MRAHSRVAAFVVVAAQLVTGAAVSVWLLVAGDDGASYSVLVGTLVGVLPGFYLAVKIFGVDVDGDPQRMLRAIYSAEAVKLAFAVALFVTVMLTMDVSVPYVLVGYLTTVLVNWFALLMPLPGPPR